MIRTLLRKMSIRIRMMCYAVLTAASTIGILGIALYVQSQLQSSSSLVVAEMDSAQKASTSLNQVLNEAESIITTIADAADSSTLETASAHFANITIPQSVADNSEQGLKSIVENHLVPNRHAVISFQADRQQHLDQLIDEQLNAIKTIKDIAQNIEFDVLIAIAEASDSASTQLASGQATVAKSLEDLGTEVSNGLETIKNSQLLSTSLSEMALTWTQAIQHQSATDVGYAIADTNELVNQFHRVAKTFGDRAEVGPMVESIDKTKESVLNNLKELQTALTENTNTEAITNRLPPLIDQLKTIKKTNLQLSEDVFFDVIINIEEKRSAITETLEQNSGAMNNQLSTLGTTIERSLASMSAIGSIHISMLQMVNYTRKVPGSNSPRIVDYIHSDLKTIIETIQRNANELDDAMSKQLLDLTTHLGKSALALCQTQQQSLRAERNFSIVRGTLSRNAEQDQKLGLSDEDIAAEALLPTLTDAQNRLHARVAEQQQKTRTQLADLVATNNASASELVQWMVTIGIATVITFLALGHLISSSVVQPLAEAVKLGNTIRDGDFSQRITNSSKDEAGQLANALNDMANSLQSNTEERERLQHNMHTVIDEATQVGSQQRSAADSLNKISTDMAASSDKTSTQAQQVASSAEEVNHNVGSVAAGIEEMNANSLGIADNVKEAVTVSREGRDLSERVTSEMNNLSDAASQIDAVVHLIFQIADQTHMLALNASIQAASAGTAGAGFSVVAQEIQSLAAQTNDAITEITDTVNSLQQRIQESVETNNQVTATMNHINQTQENISTAITHQTQTIQELAASIARAAGATDEITASISEVADEAKDNAELSSQTQGYAQELTNLAHQLNEVMSRG